ncbi:mechanosensitive ion channel family protein [Roseofilum capinflatum]|uniref:Mechanosensitive ion channel family protein n=1 Tax=Roseofilum capinflatum BLCC-M114 TaxID=3022440 RepID=A0ABT7B516_9CYAN|nr:mechanosensitive ion channel family protein [Roseofilum capinflatum]MDJ1174269.1 mechanosensitive ion channel family protein [Roseofilum capinflatum BLCC-M114]
MRSFIENVNASHEVLMEAYQEYLEAPGLFASTSVREKANTAQFFFDRAADCLDVSQVGDSLRSDTRTEATLQLKEIFDRIDIPDYSDIPDQEVILDLKEKEIDLNNWTVPETEIEITKVKEGDRAGEYLFSPSTVARTPEFYEKVKTLRYKRGATENFYNFYISTPGQLLPPKWFRFLPKASHAVYFDQTLWQWMGMFIVLIFNAIIIIFIFKWNQKRTRKFRPIRKSFARATPALLSSLLLWFSCDFIDNQLNITGTVLFSTLMTLYFFLWTMAGFIVFFVNQGIGEAIVAYLEHTQEKVESNLIRVIVDVVSFIAGGAVILFGLVTLGVNLLPLVAGLGVGGLAVALGAQSTLENVIAGLALFFDKPVVAGERCVFGDQEGFVQSIGLRSIRLQGIDGTLISMPNSQFSQLLLTNKSRSEKLLFKHQIHLSYETTSEQLNVVLDRLHKLLTDHEQTLEPGLHVRCVGYNEYSIVIELQAYINTGDIETFLLIQEELLLKVQEIVEEVGTEFAIGV